MTEAQASLPKTVPTSDATHAAAAQGSTRHFVRHFFEMLVAMLVGMAVGGGLVWGSLALLGHSDLRHYAALRAMIMATNMVIGMSLWMRYRRHGWPAISEMAAAMYLPFLVLLIPFWTGSISDGGLLGGGHLLMLPAMLAAMLYRRDEYARDHRSHH